MIDNEEMVTVYTVKNPVEAEIIKNALQAEGIRCFLEGINQAVEVGLVPQVRLQVAEHDAARARKLIQDHEDMHDETELDVEENT